MTDPTAAGGGGDDPTHASAGTAAGAAAAPSGPSLVQLTLPVIDSKTPGQWVVWKFRMETALLGCIRTTSTTVHDAINACVTQLFDYTVVDIPVDNHLATVDRILYSGIVDATYNATTIFPTLFSKIRQLPVRSGWRALRVVNEHFGEAKSKEALGASEALSRLQCNTVKDLDSYLTERERLLTILNDGGNMPPAPFLLSVLLRVVESLAKGDVGTAAMLAQWRATSDKIDPLLVGAAEPAHLRALRHAWSRN